MATRPDAIAVADASQRATYRELWDGALRCAGALSTAGVRPGDAVGVCLPRSVAAIQAMLGVLAAGAAYVPLDPRDPPARRRDLLARAGARVVVDAAFDLAGHEPAAPRAGDLAYVLFTSGSSGAPKGVEVTHDNLAFRLTPPSPVLPRADDVVLQVVPLTFDVSCLEIWGALAAGARLELAAPGPPDPAAVGTLIRERGVTFAAPSPGVLGLLAEQALEDLAGLRRIVVAGDVLPPALAATLLDALPATTLINAYGPTETTILATAHVVRRADLGGPIPIGRPLPGDVIDIRDGALWIGGPGVARGYRGDARQTSARFAGGYYDTGDRVVQRPDGTLEFHGRADGQVKVGGVRVELAEVEAALARHPGVGACAVVAREDAPGRRRLIGYAATTASPQELRDHVARLLPRAMVPAVMVALDALPLTDRGKVDRAALPAPAIAGDRPGADAPAETVALVAAQIARVLGVDEADADADFFALGGDSLGAVSLAGALREATGIALGIDAVFGARTARAIAARIGQDPGPRLPPLRQGPRVRECAATAAQRRAWLFERRHPGARAYQFPALLRIAGDLDVPALRAALGDLLGRHDALRAAFDERDGELVQRFASDVALPLTEEDLRGAGGPAIARRIRAAARVRVDPAQAPLVRWTLLRTGDRAWALVHVEHHLCHDGWSFAVLCDELAALYAHHRDGAPPLPPPTAQIADAVRWEQATAGHPAREAQLDHWCARLDADPPLLDLATDRPRGARESFDGGLVRRTVDAGAAARLRALARDEGTTLYAVALAAFALQLARTTGHEDLQIGCGLANRHDPATTGLVGMLVNTVVLRIDLSGDPTVRELLRRAADVVLDALAHPDAPIDAVVERLAPPRHTDRSPLVQALFSFHDAPRGTARWPGLDVRVTPALPDGTAKADLNVIGIDDGDGPVRFAWEHSDLLTDATAARLAEHHVTLMEAFAADPSARLSTLDMRTPAERTPAPATPARHDPTATIPSLVLAQARRSPRAPAVLAGDETLSYHDLDARSAALAGALQRAGVAPGDRVGLVLDRGVDAVVAQLAILRAGAAYVPLDPAHPQARRQRALQIAGARVVVGETALAAGAAADLDRAAPTDLAYVTFTSGSTGEPKGVAVTHRNVARLVQRCAFADVGPGTVTLHAAPLAFDAATFEVWGPLCNGGALAVLPGHPHPAAIADCVRRHRVDTAWLTAGLFHAVVDHQPAALGALRHVLAGGDVLSPDHVRRALALLPAGGRLTNGYGPTEGTTFTTTHELRPGDEVGPSVPIGRPVPGTSCHVLDPAGREQPVNVTGELWIGGDGVAAGYHGDPELTAQRFRDGRYRTGDLVVRRADGTLEFRGRTDRQLKVRGVRVEPAEVESALRAHPGVADVAVARDARGVLAAYLVPPPGGRVPHVELLRAHARARLPEAMVPGAWVPVDRLPLTVNGKLDRARLPVAPAPRNHVHGRATGRTADVAAVFAETLQLDAVGPDDDFFALGGHSLLALGLCARLERLAGRRVPPAAVFAAPTPRGLADWLGDDPRRGDWDCLVPLRTHGSRPPLFCVTAGDGNAFAFGALARALGDEQPVHVLQPRGMDGSARFDRRIVDFADRYLAEIRRVAPHGPYLIAGRCNGATVAVEVCRRLRDAGEEVALLAALDSRPPALGPPEVAPGVPRDRIADAAVGRAIAAGALAYPGPGGHALAEWLAAPAAPGVSRYLLELRHRRADLRVAFPDPLGRDAAALAAWGWSSGVVEGVHPQLLVPSGRPAVVATHRRPPAAAGRRRLAAGRAVLRALHLLPRPVPGASGWLHRAARSAAREAIESHHAEPLAIEVLHIRSPSYGLYPQLGEAWWAVTGAVDEHWVDAEHHLMLRAPAVADVAAILQDAIVAALDRTAGGAHVA